MKLMHQFSKKDIESYLIMGVVGGTLLLNGASSAQGNELTHTVPEGEVLNVKDNYDKGLILGLKNSTVTVENGAVLKRGSDGRSAIMHGGKLILKDGSRLDGLSQLDQGALGEFGVGAKQKVNTDWIMLEDHSTGHFDNIAVKALGHADGKSEGLTLADSTATLTNNTSIEGSDGAHDGIDMVGHSVLNAIGSTLKSDRGIAMMDTSRANLKDTTIDAHSAGIVAAGHTQLDVNGGHVVAEGQSLESRGGIDNIGVVILSDHNGIYSPSVAISNHAVIEGKGTRSAGLVSQSDAFNPAKITIADSTIAGGTYGIVFIQNAKKKMAGTGYTDVTLTNAQIIGGLSEAIHVDKNARAVITSDAGTILRGANGVLIDTESGSKTQINVNGTHLDGNVINHDGDTTLNLNKGAAWRGVAQQLTNLNVAKGAAWSLTGPSSITGNVVNSGDISLARENVAGTVLTLNGNYVGDNGTLIFNTTLEGDSSATDKMVVTGNTGGLTHVAINNVHGKGAQTASGIALIEVRGLSEGTFEKSGRITAGAYDYDLVRGEGLNEKNWFLTSSLTAFPSPYVQNNMIRPEAGSYIANQASTSMFLTRLHDRQGETRLTDLYKHVAGKTSLWLRQVGSHTVSRDSSGQLNTQNNAYIAQLGGDIADWSRNGEDLWRIGLMAGYGSSHNNTHSSVTGYSSKGSVTGYSAGVYGTWFQHSPDQSGFYTDGQLQYAWFNNQVNGDKLDAESYHSKGLITSVESGYTWLLGQTGRENNFNQYYLEPNAQISWLGVKSGSFHEKNETNVSLPDSKNIQTRLGLRAYMKHSKIVNAQVQVFQPFIEVNWLHNTRREGVIMDGVAIEQAGAVDTGEAKLGLEGQLSASTQVWGNVAYQQGTRGFNNSSAMLGVKYSF